MKERGAACELGLAVRLDVERNATLVEASGGRWLARALLAE